MKQLLLAVAVAALLVSCEKENDFHTGDLSGTLYGIWALDTKTEIYKSGETEKTDVYDYSKNHFYLSLSEPRIAMAKKGSFTELDLDDVDVDAVTFSYNSDKKTIKFDKVLWLSDEFLTCNMILSGTFDVTELTDKTFVIKQLDLLGKTTVYSYHRYR